MIHKIRYVSGSLNALSFRQLGMVYGWKQDIDILPLMNLFNLKMNLEKFSMLSKQ